MDGCSKHGRVLRTSNTFQTIMIVWIAFLASFSCRDCYALMFPSGNRSPRLTATSTPGSTLLQYSEVHADDTGFGSQRFDDRYNGYLPEWLLDKCSTNGWEYPTDVQQLTLDAILMENKTDIVVQAQTGSGKTLAFLLPCLAAIDPTRSAVQALIVVPTRELGLQVAKVAKRLATGPGSKKIMVMSVLQGSQNRRQRAWAWAEPPHIVIGTPEELCNMVRFGGIKRYNSIKYLIVDEVDACLLNNGGKTMSKLILSSGTPLHELLSRYLSPTYDDGQAESDLESTSVLIETNKPRPVQNERHTIFCSATIPQIRHFLKQCVQNQWMLQSPRHISVRPGDLPSRIRHGFVVCSETAVKLQTVRRIIRKIDLSTNNVELDHDDARTIPPKKILLFAEPSRPLEEMAKVIANDISGGLYWNEQTADVSDRTSIRVAVLRYEDSLSQRATALDGFREGSAGAILLSTDLAARGLDVADISHVIQLDLADSADTYVHRSGRTGRLGKPGQVINILTPEQEFVLQRLANALQVKMRCIGRRSEGKATKHLAGNEQRVTNLFHNALMFNRIREGGSSMFARPIQNSIRPPNRSRQQHMESYLKHPNVGPSTRQVTPDDSTFDTIFQSVEGDTLILRVHWPVSSFETVQPLMTLAGVEARHSWLDSRMRVTGYPSLQSLESWKAANLLLGDAVLAVIQHLQLNPPNILRFTDAGLISIQKTPPKNTGSQSSPPPPAYKTSTSSRQQPPPPPPPSNISLPPIPNSFPELDTCSLDQVKKLMTDHLDMQAFCAKLKYMQDLKAIQTKSLDENHKVSMDRTSACETQLTNLNRSIGALEEELKTKVKEFQALEKKQQEILKPAPLRDVRKKLVAGKKKAFDTSEAIADKWTGTNADAFLSEFLEARKVHHMRAAKLELLDHSHVNAHG